MRPSTETFRKFTIRIGDRSITTSRNAANVEAPAVPASAAATTPRRRCASSGGAPTLDTCWKMRVWPSTSPGSTRRPEQSVTCAASAASPSPTAAIVPPLIATSSTASTPDAGSMTVPPVSTRS